MERKLWGLFSGTQLTVMFTAAMAVLVPSALWAYNEALTKAVIVDQKSGATAHVEHNGGIDTFDKLASYARDPSNFVRFFGAPNCGTAYAPPAGKALILLAMTAYNHAESPGTDVELDVFDQASCSGNFIAGAISDNSVTHTSIAQSFGTGIAIPAGGAISASGVNDGGSFMGYGYLVPANAVPAEVYALNGGRPTPRTTRIRR